MNRNELLRRQQMRKAQSGIPGWLWGAMIGGVVAFAVAGVTMRRPSMGNASTDDPVSAPQQPATGGANTPVAAIPREGAIEYRDDVTVAVERSQPRRRDDAAQEQAAEIELLREELEELRRERDASYTPDAAAAPSEELPQPQEPGPSAADLRAEAEREWRPAFLEFQKRYSETKQKHDERIGMLEQYEAQCNYTHMGEPTVAERRRGVRQEGLPASMVLGGNIDYAKLNCDSIEYDLRDAKKAQFDALQSIQRECYDEAIARGVSVAMAKLR